MVIYMIIKAADRIKLLRESFCMTQSDLAKKLGVTRSGVNGWEMGISLPSLANLVELANLFHVRTDYILGIEDEDTLSLSNLTEKEKSLIRQLVAQFEE